MQVVKLFIKPKHGAPLESVTTILGTSEGIAGGVPCAPFRHALIASQPVIAECGLKPGDLRENILVDCLDLYELPSGMVVKIGQSLLRLTFHCEPCKRISLFEGLVIHALTL